MEANRPWLAEWDGLDVVVQKGISLRGSWRHPHGFQEPVSLHFPLDTVWQLRRFRPDVIISAEMGFRTLLAYAYASVHPRCRLLIWSEVTAITEQGRGAGRQMLRRFLARRVHGFLALGPGGVRYLQSLGGDQDKIFKIAYSTDLMPFLHIPMERHGSSAKRLLFSGQLVSRKGLRPFVEILIEWATGHPGQRVEFTFVGDGPEKAALTAMPVPDNVKLIFIGTVQYNQLPAVYADAGIFVLPTLADTWAVVVNEALASGVPVLGSIYSQAVEEMVEDGKNGWVFRPDHPAEIYSAIDRALSSTDAELNSMRMQARSAALCVTPEQTAADVDGALRAVNRNM